MARRPGQIFPFRIPFFRIFYSTTYTALYILVIAFIVVTPASMMYQAIAQKTFQYTFMIGATHVLVAILAIIVYCSRLYTNRTVLAGVGKAYIPIEAGEVVYIVRKMIVKQLERSAIVAWESRPRDLYGEILAAETAGYLPPESEGLGRHDYTVGRLISLDPENPPWGVVRHAGWSSPSSDESNQTPDLQFAPVISELPNLVEARAVSLAPLDPALGSSDAPPAPNPVFVDLLKRPETAGMRDYLTQLSYLGLINPPEIANAFLLQYERARFGGIPVAETEFKSLMETFSELLSGMVELDKAIIDQILLQTSDRRSSKDLGALEQWPSSPDPEDGLPPPLTPVSSSRTPVTARTRPSRNATPYLQHDLSSVDSFSSVVRRTPDELMPVAARNLQPQETDSSSLASLSTDGGSVLINNFHAEDG